MTSSLRYCCKSLLASSLAGIFVAWPGTSLAQPRSVTENPLPGVAVPTAQAVQPAHDAQELFLDVTLNRVRTGKLARFEVRNEGLWTDAATLQDLGIHWSSRSRDDHEMVALSAIAGLQVDYNAQTQRIQLTAPLAMLNAPAARIDVPPTRAARANPEDQLRGLVVNYDLYGQHLSSGSSGGSTTLSAFSDMRLMGVASGNLNNTMISRTTLAHSSMDGSQQQSGTVRMDTFWQRNFQDSMLTLTVGDTATSGLNWTRSTRIGGIRLSRNFALQPYRVTTPLAMVQGDATLPSTVDLDLNGLRQSTQQVLPGQFTLGNIPTLNGLGEAQMVITDINGQQRTINMALYGASQLLQAGLSDWSVELGSVRRDYGLRSFSYGNCPVASASGRYGVNDRLTVEAHGEGNGDLQMLGAGAHWLLGSQLGVLSASAAASTYDGKTGQQGGIGYQWNSTSWSLNASTLRRDSAFRDVASMDGFVPTRSSDQLFVGTNTRWGNWGAGYVGQTSADGNRARYVNLSWYKQLTRNISLNVNAMRDLSGSANGSGTSVYASLSIPLDRQLSLSATARSSQGKSSAVLGATQSVPSDTGGWGWRAEAGVGNSRYAQAQVTHLGQLGQTMAGVLYQPGTHGGAANTSTYASASGGLLWTQGSLHPMRTVQDAFAMVSTDGIADVPVRLENRLVGKTDERGLLLLDRLNSYQLNRLSIDTLNLPPDMQISKVQLDAVPQSQNGVLARFPMRKVTTATLHLKDEQGRFLPAGGDAWLEADTAEQAVHLVIGFDGLVYLEDPPANARIRTLDANGKTCVFELAALQTSESAAEDASQICRAPH